MKTLLALATLGLALSASPVMADDEMMGTMINGRVETRGERSVRVPDPDMDREEAIIDREKRLNRNTTSRDDEISAEDDDDSFEERD